MHVAFVLPDVYALAILESGKISLNRELNVSAAASGMLLLAIANAIFTSAEATCLCVSTLYMLPSDAASAKAA